MRSEWVSLLSTQPLYSLICPASCISPESGLVSVYTTSIPLCVSRYNANPYRRSCSSTTRTHLPRSSQTTTSRHGAERHDRRGSDCCRAAARCRWKASSQVVQVGFDMASCPKADIATMLTCQINWYRGNRHVGILAFTGAAQGELMHLLHVFYVFSRRRWSLELTL